jgi:antitoxin component YwqK of YwqJK toxin-antitoxin module
MELLAPYRNKLLTIIGFGILLTALYCIAPSKTIPSIWVNSNNAHLHHINGILCDDNKAFSGWLYSNYPNGNRERQTPYYEGKEEGIMKSWYPDGSPEQERVFVNGEKQGTHRGWWPNGSPKFEYQFKDDEHNGTAKEWFSNNKLYRLFRYTNGHEDGLQQMWWDNGTVRSNYVVKDGQQYGLIGRKFCKNVFKNEAIKNSNPSYAVAYGLP